MGAKLTKLVINKFRNIEPGTVLEFHAGFNILVGKNASGKTTLLKLLAKMPDLSRPGSDRFDREEYDIQIEVVSTSGTASWRARNAYSKDVPTLPGELASEASVVQAFPYQTTHEVLLAPKNLEPLTIALLSEEVRVSRKGTKPWPTRRQGWPPALEAIRVIRAGDLVDQAKTTYSTLLEEASLPRLSVGRLDESLDYMNDYLGQAFAWEGGVLSPVGGWRTHSASLFRALSAKASGADPDNPIGHDRLPFLDVAAKAMGYDSAQLRFDLEKTAEQDGQKSVFSNFRFFFFGSDGETISHQALSYGQKRLLAFFAYAEDCRDVVIADELVNGLHHDWIRLCIDTIGERQSFLTSQNPILMDFMHFESADDVRKAFIFCDRKKYPGGVRLIWRNPTEEEAAEFFSAYQAGVQRVSDILLSKGLW